MDDLFLFIALIGCGYMGWILHRSTHQSAEGYRCIRKSVDHVWYKCKNCGRVIRYKRDESAIVEEED